jgi:O-antigen/teichoic acid export membrane protein
LASLNLARIVLRDLRFFPMTVSWRRIRELAKEYKDFPLYSGTMNVINAISLNMPVFLLTRYFGIELAGAYAFAMRILSAPMGLVQKALRQVLYQKACETQNAGGRLLPLFLKFTGGLFLMALGPALILGLWAPPLFSWIFGAQWRMAGVFAQSLVLWLALVFSNLPAVLFSRVVRAQRQMFLYDLVVLALRTLALVAGGLYLTAASTVLLYALAGIVMNIVYIVIIYMILKRREGHISWKDVLTDLKEGPA